MSGYNAEGLELEVIREIDKETVRLIAAGQKICDVETVVRELIENSIDAGAKAIEIRLARFGADSIEVDDNGTGIDESNFKNIAIRYHTSKIEDFNALQEGLITFGFRGEALSCICSVAQVTLTTKTKTSPTGSKLVFDKSGRLTDRKPFARTNGTTINVKNLFHSMPVRRKELEATAKRQYDKVVRLLYEQILARPHIKFSLCKKSTGKKEKDFVHGGSTLEGCIITIFGIKMLNSIMPIRQSGIELIAADAENEESHDSLDSKVSVQTRVTRSSGQTGEDTPEDEVRKYLPHDFETTKEPDRDATFFKAARKSKFRREKPNYTIHGYISRPGQGKNSPDGQYTFVNKKPCDIPRLARLINDIYRSFSSNQTPFYIIFIQVQAWAADFNVPSKRQVILQDENNLCDIVKDSLEKMFKPIAPLVQKSCPSALIPLVRSEKITEGHSDRPTPAPASATENESPRPVEELNGAFLSETPKRTSGLSTTTRKESPAVSPSSRITVQTGLNRSAQGFKSALEYLPGERQGPMQPPLKKPALERRVVNVETKFKQIKIYHEGNLSVALEHFEELELAYSREKAQRKLNSDSKNFMYEIDPSFNSVSEQELKLQLNQQDFKSMDIIGQFNNGFIIARLNKHIFIIDQHATDERANYEDQLGQSPFVTQPMVHPKPLHLNTIQENAVINNLHVFQTRGFDFVIDETKMPGFKVLLKSTSICKGQGHDEYLDKSDIEELVNVITSTPNQVSTYTLKKFKTIAASRACRKSVMIGDKLGLQKMIEIVSRMANLQNPWICAHGRPTIRHLMDIDWMRS